MPSPMYALELSEIKYFPDNSKRWWNICYLWTQLSLSPAEYNASGIVLSSLELVHQEVREIRKQRVTIVEPVRRAMVFLCYDVHLLTGRQLPLKRFPLEKERVTSLWPVIRFFGSTSVLKWLIFSGRGWVHDTLLPLMIFFSSSSSWS